MKVWLAPAAIRGTSRQEIEMILHTCTMEERRFGICHCGTASIQRYEASRGAKHESDQQPHPQVPALVDQDQTHFRAAVMQRLMTAPCHDRLRILRTALGWTQRELASQLGISRRSVIRYERAQQRSEWPRLSVLLRLRRVEADSEQQLVGYFSQFRP